MQCPVCKNETIDYVEIPQIAISLHNSLTDICSCWQHSPGVCCACIDRLDMKNDSVFQRILTGTSPRECSSQPYVLNLTEQEQRFWFHHDEHVRMWFRSELRNKVKAVAHQHYHLFWSIADDNMVLLDYGEIHY